MYRQNLELKHQLVSKMCVHCTFTTAMYIVCTLNVLNLCDTFTILQRSNLGLVLEITHSRNYLRRNATNKYVRLKVKLKRSCGRLRSSGIRISLQWKQLTAIAIDGDMRYLVT